MYTKELLKERITTAAKGKGCTVKKMLLSLGLNENTVNQISDNKGLSSFSLAKIADYLDCSVDYLLGRTDEPQAKAETTTIEQNHQYIQNDSSFSIGVSLPPETLLDRNQQELLKRYNQLEYEEQIEVMQMIIQKTKKESE